MKIITEADLRVRNGTPRLVSIEVSQDTYLTPLAKEYMRDHNISLVKSQQKMQRNNFDSNCIDNEDIIKADTFKSESKPEDITHLNGNNLVHKTHPRITLRGQLDQLQAEVILLQNKAIEIGKEHIVGYLEEVLQLLRQILSSEVTGKKIEQLNLFGMNLDDLRSLSHQMLQIGGFKINTPKFSQGSIAVGLNYLRTRVRVCELACVNAFDKGERIDLIYILNRLSSAMFVLYYWEITGTKDSGGIAK